MENYYQLLGVSEMATLLEIKSAYKRLAKSYHPDINPSTEAEEKFKSISTAYTVLSNHELRRKYDVKLAQIRLNAKRASIRSQENREKAYRNPYRNYTYRPPVYQPSKDKNTERKATYYALGIVASIAFLLYVGITIFDFIQDRNLKSKISQFDEQVKHADSLYYSGKVEAALNFIDKIKGFAEELGIETRPIVGGNLLRQTIFQEYGDYKDYPNAEWFHKYGIYVGLYKKMNKRILMKFRDRIDQL